MVVITVDGVIVAKTETHTDAWQLCKEASALLCVPTDWTGLRPGPTVATRFSTAKDDLEGITGTLKLGAR